MTNDVTTKLNRLSIRRQAVAETLHRGMVKRLNSRKNCLSQTIDKSMVVAHIILKDGEQNQRDVITRIHKWCTDNLEECAIPTHYKIRDSFPVHSNGKRDNESLRNDIENLIEI